MIRKKRVTAYIPERLYDFLHENAQNNAYPSSLTEWVLEQEEEARMWHSNKEMMKRIQAISNRMDIIIKRQDLLELRLLRYEKRISDIKP